MRVRRVGRMLVAVPRGYARPRSFAWASFGMTGLSLLMYLAFRIVHQALNHASDAPTKRALERCLTLLSSEIILALLSVAAALWAFRRREGRLPFWALLAAVGAIVWRLANVT